MCIIRRSKHNLFLISELFPVSMVWQIKVYKSPSRLAILAMFLLWIWKNSPIGHKTSSFVSACAVSLGFVGKDEHWKSMWKVITVLNISACMEDGYQKEHGGRVKGGFRDLSTDTEVYKSQWNNMKDKKKYSI